MWDVPRLHSKNYIYDRLSSITNMFGKSKPTKIRSDANDFNWKKVVYFPICIGKIFCCVITWIWYMSKRTYAKYWWKFTWHRWKDQDDLNLMHIRHALYLIQKMVENHFISPCHTMSAKKKDIFWKFLHDLNSRQGYSSNISRRINLWHHRIT